MDANITIDHRRFVGYAIHKFVVYCFNSNHGWTKGKKRVAACANVTAECFPGVFSALAEEIRNKTCALLLSQSNKYLFLTHHYAISLMLRPKRVLPRLTALWGLNHTLKVTQCLLVTPLNSQSFKEAFLTQ